MPTLRPFRALRYDASAVGDLASVISPPYDVISPAQQAALVARSPWNSVRLDLPPAEPGDEPGAKYGRANADFVAWRSGGVLRKEPTAAIYPYEQTYRLPGGREERLQRGVFVRLRLEPFGPGGGILPHERTLGGPKEDRYQLLRATGANFSPVVGLYRSAGESADLLATLTAGPAAADVADDDGVRHRLWVVPAADPDLGGAVRGLLDVAGAGRVTIADGHHRYETALRYRAERAATRACPVDPPYEFVFTLLFDVAATELTILPTHRLVRGDPAGDALLAVAGALFEVEPLPGGAALAAAFAPGVAPPGGDARGQRLGVYSAGRAAILRPRRDALAPLLQTGSETLRWLDVSVLATALERLLGIDATATAGGRLAYTKDAAEAVASVDGGVVDSAFLLDPTPVEAVQAVAEAGELMPQKSTYFYPKPVTGLLLSPGEW